MKLLAKTIYKTLILTLTTLFILCFLTINVLAASTPYEVTKSGGALIRTSYSESSTSVRRAAQGSILWVVSSKVNSAGNTWYKLSDGYWIYSGNVAKHSCTWTLTSSSNPSCTASGVKNYKCNKCGQTKKTTTSAYGHNYSSNVCTRCGYWTVKSKSSMNSVRYCVKTNGAKVHSGPYGACTTTKTLSKGTNIYVTEKIVNNSNNTWYKYSGGYIFSDYVVSHTSCSWNSGTVTKKATCTATGTKVYKCTVCSGSKTTTLSKTSHSYSGNVCTKCGYWTIKSKSSMNSVRYYVKTNGAKVHSGPYGACSTVKTLSKGTNIYVTEKIVNNSNNTWYKYSGGYIFSDYVVNHSSCSWNSGTVTKKATCTATGTKVYKCTVCSGSKTTTLSKIGHNYSSNVCTKCGTWKTSSLKSKSSINNVKYCIVSSSAKVRSGPYEKCKTVKTPSKGTDIVVTQKVVNASGNTWYKCSSGYIYSNHVKKHSSCSWNSGTVTKKATCTATGTKVYKCTICGKSKTTTLAKHNYDKNVCTKCGAWKTSSLKSKSSVNNVKYCVVSSSAKVRSGPYEKCKTAKKLSKASVIVVTQKVVNASGNTWYKCSDGYIFADHVKKHTFTYGVCQACGKKESSSYAKAQFKKNASVAVKFSDKLFLESSKKFSDKLCRISAAGMAASYDEDYGKDFLKNCGFEKIEAKNSSSEKSTDETGKNDHARYIIGYKKISGTNTTLVAVLVNGYTSGKYEWISNFNVGKSGLHTGFAKATDEITDKVNSYIKKKKINTKNIKIWITGHSRGGAVAGMTAANLNYKYGVENVFAYGFATPNGVPNSMKNKVPNNTSKKVNTDNIFNIVNTGDFVPYVVPSKWGFTKYGKTIELTVGENTKSVYSKLAKDSYSGLDAYHKDIIIDKFEEYAGDRKEYNKDKNFLGQTPKDFGRGIGLFMAGKEIDGKAKVIFTNPGLGTTLKDNKSKITEAHCVETYLALVNAQTPSKKLK